MIYESLLCIAATIYHEARGENLDGQLAVANVVITRSANSGRNVCDEISVPYQFSWYSKDKVGFKDKKDEIKFIKLASLALFYPDNTNGASFFHNTTVSPSWSKVLPYKGTYGTQRFYGLPDQSTYSWMTRVSVILQ